jgi:hypothetical protein
VIEQLQDLALVRQDVGSGTVSIHRVVQSEFLFYLKTNERQKTFDATVLMLLKVFPDRGKSRVIDKDWATGEKYIGQVLTVLKTYECSLSEQEPLNSSKNFLDLTCNAAWYGFL